VAAVEVPEGEMAVAGAPAAEVVAAEMVVSAGKQGASEAGEREA
jgi:hypothetical protein